MNENVYARLLAYSLLLGILVDKLKETDPNFEKNALGIFDRYLGHVVISGEIEAPDTLGIKAREIFVDTIKTPANYMARLPPPDPKKMTLRRAFLNWLERG